MTVRFGRKFSKQYNKAPQIIKSIFGNKLKLFQQNPYNSSLNNHALTGKLKGYRSINVTGDWRAIYSVQKDGIILFELLGTHSQLYG